MMNQDEVLELDKITEDYEKLYRLSVALWKEVEWQWGTPAVDDFCAYIRKLWMARGGKE